LLIVSYFAVSSFFNRKGRKEIRKVRKEKEKDPLKLDTPVAYLVCPTGQRIDGLAHLLIYWGWGCPLTGLLTQQTLL